MCAVRFRDVMQIFSYSFVFVLILAVKVSDDVGVGEVTQAPVELSFVTGLNFTNSCDWR